MTYFLRISHSYCSFTALVLYFYFLALSFGSLKGDNESISMWILIIFSLPLSLSMHRVCVMRQSVMRQIALLRAFEPRCRFWWWLMLNVEVYIVQLLCHTLVTGVSFGCGWNFPCVDHQWAFSIYGYKNKQMWSIEKKKHIRKFWVGSETGLSAQIYEIKNPFGRVYIIVTAE